MFFSLLSGFEKRRNHLHYHSGLFLCKVFLSHCGTADTYVNAERTPPSSALLDAIDHPSIYIAVDHLHYPRISLRKYYMQIIWSYRNVHMKRIKDGTEKHEHYQIEQEGEQIRQLR